MVHSRFRTRLARRRAFLPASASAACAPLHMAMLSSALRQNGCRQRPNSLLFCSQTGRVLAMSAPLPLPALHATHAGIWLASGDGEVREASRGEAIARAAETPHIILNAPLVGQRLGYPELSGLDLLELFAFIHPARFAVPTVPGLSRAIGLRPTTNEPGAAAQLQRIAGSLIAILSDANWREREGAWTANATLQRLGWGWAALIGARLERPQGGERMLFSRLKQ